MASAEAQLRRRHRGRRRSRAGDGLLPGDTARHHRRGGGGGRLHRERQLRSQHHHHPCQLRHPRVDPVLPPQPRALQPARGRDGLLDHLLNTACGAPTELITPQDIKQLCPLVDITGGGRYPVMGASHHLGGASARHDRVVWAYAQGAMRAGVHVLQGTPVVDLLRDGDRVVGVRTPAGDIGAGVVMSAAGGDVTQLVGAAGLRLPVRTHPLQAFVTNGYAQTLGPIVSSTEFLAYVSQTARGQMLIGHEYEREQSFSLQSSFQFLQSCSAKMSYMLPFLRDLKILRQWTGRCDISADQGSTGTR
ncbi:MAG: FAD-dependent oxidoreductase [Actinobacteria bacterium]|nr:FAD-dependent oxidoreductase [Actinomycetota bacterium]